MLNRLIDYEFYLFGYNLPIDPKAQTGDLGIFLFFLFVLLLDLSKARRNSAGEFLKALWTMYMNSGWGLVVWLVDYYC
jgi:hypothetical protein